MILVKELREKLLLLPADMPVYVSKDAEGNMYLPLADAEVCEYGEESGGCDIYLLDDEDIEEDDPKALVLWPV